MEEELIKNLKETVDHLWGGIREERYSGRPDGDIRDKLVFNLQNKDRRFIDLLTVSFVRQICMTKLNDIYFRHIPADKPNYILSYYNARTSGEQTRSAY